MADYDIVSESLSVTSKLNQYSFADSLEDRECENDRNETNTLSERASVFHKPPPGDIRRLPPRTQRSGMSNKPKLSSKGRYSPVHNPVLSSSFSSSSLAESLPESEASINSDQLREDVYLKWLSEKNEKIRLAKRIAIAKQKDNESALKKTLDRKERSKSAYSLWLEQKAKQARIKTTKSPGPHAHDNTKDRENQNEIAYKQWHALKTDVLLKRVKNQKRIEKQEAEQREQEKLEKQVIKNKAFDSWVSRKNALMLEKKQKALEKAKQQLLETESATQSRKAESTTAYEAWKTKKNSKIRQQKKLYTYQVDPQKPPKNSKWCPARSMSYDYPVDDAAMKLIRKTCKSSPRTGTVQQGHCKVEPVANSDTYSECSFESDEPLDDSLENSKLSGSGSKSLSPTGRLKTIDVCCQRLEYWCICKD